MDPTLSQLYLESLTQSIFHFFNEHKIPGVLETPFTGGLSLNFVNIIHKTVLSQYSTDDRSVGFLRPVVSTICNHPSNGRHLPPKELDIKDNCIPTLATFDDNCIQTLAKSFFEEVRRITTDDISLYAETLLNIIQKYFTNIPASQANEDVSLYDQTRISAALSVCLFLHQNSKSPQDSPFLLIGGDLSGIQPFIFEIVSKYASKNLKGRSFYLRLLSDSIVHFLLNSLNLFEANVVYNSGGSFFIIAPNTKEVLSKLEEATKTIESHLFHQHGSSLYAAIAYVEIPEQTILAGEGQPLSHYWDLLFSRRDKKKNCKFADLIHTNPSLFFAPYGGKNEFDNHDSITGEEIPVYESAVLQGDLFLRPITAKQIQMGQELRNTRYIIRYHLNGHDTLQNNGNLEIEPLELGFHYLFIKNINELGAIVSQFTPLQKATVISLNITKDFIHNNKNTISSFEFYGGNELPDSELITFDQMAKGRDFQFSRLGILRMDVDNLGKIFKSGLPENRQTLARYAALSRSLDLFFSGYLNSIWKETDAKHSFIIYSGGDDLFIVGDWQVLINIAERIHRDFKSYTCNNPALTISGGIAIISPKYPIMRGAEQSAEEESLAKKHSCNSELKNSLSFLGTPLNWDHEYPIVKKLKDRIVALSRDSTNPLPKSFVSKVLLHYTNFDFNNLLNLSSESLKKHRARQYWLIPYDFSRFRGRTSHNSLIDTFIREICDKNSHTLNGESIKTEYHALQLWGFACRWAELELRS